MGVFDEIKLGEPAPAPLVPSFVERVTDLARACQLKVKPAGEGTLRALFTLEDGRQQQVVFSSPGELRGQPLLTIHSPIADLGRSPLVGDTAVKLLRASAEMKIGAFTVLDSFLVVQQTIPLENLTPASFAAVVLTLVKTADDAEKAFTGTDLY